MADSVRAWVVQSADGGLFCGAHPYESADEAAIAAATIADDIVQAVRLVELIDPAPLRREIAALRRAVKRGQYRWARDLWRVALVRRDNSLLASSVVHYHREAERLLALAERLRKELENG